MNSRATLPVLGQGLLLAFVIACGIFPMTDTDIWWHLSAGRWIWEHHAIPRVDPFSASALGLPWLDAQWGFQLIVYPLWKVGGGFALVLAKALVFAAVFALVFARKWTVTTAPFLLAAGIFAAFHGRHLADVRPVWATVLLLAWQYRLLRDYLDARRSLPWFWLLLSQLVLVQMQGLYWLGPAQFAVMILCTRRTEQSPSGKRSLHFFAPLFLGLIVTSLINPYGWCAWSFPFKLWARIVPSPGNLFSLEVAENAPFWRWLHEYPAAAFPFIVLAAIAVALLIWTRAREARGESGLLLMYGVLGLMAQRNLILFLFAFLIVLSRTVPVLVAGINSSGTRFRIAAVFAMTWSVLSLVGYAADIRASWRWEQPGSWETPLRFPQGATEYLQKHPLRGPVFNEMRHGGYLGWHLWPQYQPFIDGRMILHDAEFMREFLDLFDHPERFEAYRQRYGIQVVVLPIGEDDRYLGLATALARDPAWTVLYCDGAEILVARPEAWEGGSTPVAWTVEAGNASAVSRFGMNPLLLERARRKIAQIGEDFSAPSSASFTDQLITAEESTFRQFPSLASPSISLRDSLESYRRRLESSGFTALKDSLRVEILAHFLFDSLRLQSVDAGDDLGLSLPSRVLQDRRGSCTGLAFLLMALAEKNGVEARPVFLPGHIFVRLKSGPDSWRNVELLRDGIARSDSFYASTFRLRERPRYSLVSRKSSQALAALIFNRGNAHREAGRSTEALHDYRRAEKMLPGFPEAVENIKWEISHGPQSITNR